LPVSVRQLATLAYALGFARLIAILAIYYYRFDIL
jgi:hypothetical protein